MLLDSLHHTVEGIWWFPKIRGTILGSILGSPHLGKLPHILVGRGIILWGTNLHSFSLRGVCVGQDSFGA